MNIRFLAQSEYFNGIHLKDDIILEKEYEQGRFTNLPRVRYYLYYLEENVRKEVMPHSEKIDIFQITDCGFESDYLYFTEYDVGADGAYIFNIIRYNLTDHTHNSIITLKDNIDAYPLGKQIKIYILDDSNLLIQRALPKVCSDGKYRGFFDFSLILFDFVKNKQITIQDENLQRNGIEFIIPYGENSCIMKTGYSLFEDDRHDILTRKEAAVESMIVFNIQQFISDLQLDEPNLIISAIDRVYYDSTIIDAKISDGFLIYSKYDYEKNSGEIVFYNLDTKDTYTYVSPSGFRDITLKNAAVIDSAPYIAQRTGDGTKFLNLTTENVDSIYPDDYNIRFINNYTIVSSFIEKSFLGKPKEMVAIQKYPSKKTVVQERGEFIGAVASNEDTTYIFLK